MDGAAVVFVTMATVVGAVVVAVAQLLLAMFIVASPDRILAYNSSNFVDNGLAQDRWTERQEWSNTTVSFTVVTALLDIGRGQWRSSFARPYSLYLDYMAKVMALRVNLFVFADSMAASILRRMRGHHDYKTWVVETKMEDLPLFQKRNKILQIMRSKAYRRGNALARLGYPEANVPEYDILMLSKTFFVNHAMSVNPFNSSYFIWLDAGYGHGLNIFPQNGQWRPQNLFEHHHKVTLIERGRGSVLALREDTHRLHKLPLAALVGGFFGGGKRALQRLHVLQQEVVSDWLEQGVIDDDQSCMVTAYFREPFLFRLVLGDWWDVFKLFHS